MITSITSYNLGWWSEFQGSWAEGKAYKSFAIPSSYHCLWRRAEVPLTGGPSDEDRKGFARLTVSQTELNSARPNLFLADWETTNCAIYRHKAGL